MSEQVENKEKKNVVKKKEINAVVLRDYSKAIFLYPLFFSSIVLWILQLIYDKPVAGFGFFWLVVFFVNIIVMSFDVSSGKFFIMVLTIVLAIVLFIFLVLPSVQLTALQNFETVEFNIGMTANFYMTMTVILGFVLFFVFLGANFDFWRIERNEIYHKKGLFVSADRYPTTGLQFKKEISDVFEFFLLRTGSVTLLLGKSDTIHLGTVLNVDKKAKQLDFLLSDIKVEVDTVKGPKNK